MRFSNVIARNKLTALAVTLLALIVASGFAAPLITSYNPTHIDPIQRLAAPDFVHWFGTDAFGRDIYTRAIYGTRISLIVGVGVLLISIAAGVVLGASVAISRYLDAVIMRIMDTLMAIPGILLAIALVSLIGASATTVIIAISVPQVPRVARVVRSVVLGVLAEPYVEAGRILGSSRVKILIRHMLPSAIAPLTVHGTYIFASAILTEATLSFIGAGMPPEIPSWGNMIAEGRVYFELFPGMVLFPGAFLAIMILSINILGDATRDALDPKLKSR